MVKIKEKRIRMIENENLSNFFLVLKFFILSLFLSVYKTWVYIQHTKKEKKNDSLKKIKLILIIVVPHSQCPHFTRIEHHLEN